MLPYVNRHSRKCQSHRIRRKANFTVGAWTVSRPVRPAARKSPQSGYTYQTHIVIPQTQEPELVNGGDDNQHDSVRRVSLLLIWQVLEIGRCS